MKRIFLLLTLIIGHLSVACAFETAAEFAILIDADTKEILFEKNANQRMSPSSMSKMMTAYLAFDFINKGVIKETDLITISENAWKTEGSRMFVSVGSSVPIIELLKGLVIQSGNDAAVALAEGISGTEEEFARQMNSLAKKINLTGSNFANATGLPNPNHYTTARDLAEIAIRTIKDFPQYYPLYAEKEFTYNSITQQNRSTLLSKNIGCDGLKTGHTEEAGFSLTSSAIKNGRRLVTVVNGLKNDKARILETEKLLAHGFTNFRSVQMAKAGEVLGIVKILYGTKDSIEIKVDDDLKFTVASELIDKVKIKINHPEMLTAPIAKGQEIASLLLEAGDYKKEIKIYSKEDIAKAGFFARALTNIMHFVGIK